MILFIIKKPLVFITLITVISISLITLVADDYSVSVTRKGQDLYLIDGKNIYIKTKYCYEYSYSEKVLLKYTGYGYSKGKLIFKGNKEFDIEEFYESTEVARGTIGLDSYGIVTKDIKELLVPTKLR